MQIEKDQLFWYNFYFISRSIIFEEDKIWKEH